MVRAIHKIQAAWDKMKANKKLADKILGPEIHVYYLAGVNQSSLWRGTYREGDERMIMREWIKNYTTSGYEWVRSFHGEWATDKKYRMQEINAFEAEYRFPGCVGKKDEKKTL
jgi:hypothetical protein